MTPQDIITRLKTLTHPSNAECDSIDEPFLSIAWDFGNSPKTISIKHIIHEANDNGAYLSYRELLEIITLTCTYFYEDIADDFDSIDTDIQINETEETQTISIGFTLNR